MVRVEVKEGYTKGDIKGQIKGDILSDGGVRGVTSTACLRRGASMWLNVEGDILSDGGVRGVTSTACLRRGASMWLNVEVLKSFARASDKIRPSRYLRQ